MSHLFSLPDDETQKEFDARLHRIFTVVGCQTQLALADFLNIKQSSISDAKRRCKIPAEWLIKLVSLRRITPDWIKEGVGPQFLLPSDEPANATCTSETFPPAKADDATILRKVLRCFPLRYLTEELL